MVEQPELLLLEIPGGRGDRVEERVAVAIQDRAGSSVEQALDRLPVIVGRNRAGDTGGRQERDNDERA